MWYNSKFVELREESRMPLRRHEIYEFFAYGYESCCAQGECRAVQVCIDNQPGAGQGGMPLSSRGRAVSRTLLSNTCSMRYGHRFGTHNIRGARRHRGIPRRQALTQTTLNPAPTPGPFPAPLCPLVSTSSHAQHHNVWQALMDLVNQVVGPQRPQLWRLRW